MVWLYIKNERLKMVNIISMEMGRQGKTRQARNNLETNYGNGGTAEKTNYDRRCEGSSVLIAWNSKTAGAAYNPEDR